MAKGKHAAALFEVIHRDKRFAKGALGAAAGFRAPWWLFKRRGSGAGTTPAKEETAPLSASPSLSPGAVDRSSVNGEKSSARSDPTDQRSPISDYRLAITEDASPAALGSDAASAPRMEVAVDRQRRQIAFRLTYTSAITAGFAVFVLLGLAYVLGQRVGQAPSSFASGHPALGNSTEAIRNAPPQPGVLNVGRGEAPVRYPAGNAANTTTRGQQTTRSFNEPRPPVTHTELDAKRAVNLNYIVIQSYTEEKTANDARDLLVQHGILCTVEKDLPGWLRYSVVGVVGFERIRNVPEYDAQIKSIMAVSGKFGSSRFNRFDPHPFKWRG